MSKSKKIFLVSILSILIVSCALTNPNKNEYVNWHKEKFNLKVQIY